MPRFLPGGGNTTPFGRNEPLRSTKGLRSDGWTFSSVDMPAQTIDGNAGQKVLQPGVLVAKITSGARTGKYGVFQAGVTDGRQTAANIVGINQTFLPWQLMDGDEEISAWYSGVFLQARCIEYDSSGAAITLSNTTRDAMLALPRFTTVVFE